MENSPKIWRLFLKIIKENYLLIITLFTFFILVFTSVAKDLSIAPDFLNLSKVDLQNYYGLIISTIASIFGILIAFVLLAVEVLKEKLYRNNHSNPLENKLIRDVILNSVNLIFISFFSYVYFENFETSKSITIGYFIGFIFVSYIYSIFHVLREIISSTSLIKRNLNLVDSLSYSDFLESSKNKYLNFNKDSQIKQFKKEIDTYILTNNTIAYETLNNKILKRVFEILLIDLDDRDKFSSVFSSLTWIWRENCKTADRVNDSNYFDNIWVSIEL